MPAALRLTKASFRSELFRVREESARAAPCTREDAAQKRALTVHRAGRAAPVLLGAPPARGPHSSAVPRGTCASCPSDPPATRPARGAESAVPRGSQGQWGRGRGWGGAGFGRGQGHGAGPREAGPGAARAPTAALWTPQVGAGLGSSVLPGLRDPLPLPRSQASEPEGPRRGPASSGSPRARVSANPGFRESGSSRVPGSGTRGGGAATGCSSGARRAPAGPARGAGGGLPAGG